MAAFSHSTPDTRFREAVRSKLDCMHEPPFSPTTTLSGNYHLESNPERHDKSPVAVAIGKGFTEQSSRVFYRVLEVVA
jgi:hypothetical protein